MKQINRLHITQEVVLMNINVQGINNPFLGRQSVFSRSGLKSTEEKLERQAKRDNQVAFFENQKENLKNMECKTLDEIARKLDMLHSYEDQIKEVKAAYNSEQMMHILDESRELGEKIAEAAEKMEPKTPEERLEELVEEAMGMEDGGGMLDEVMEDVAKMQEELEEELQEELQQEIQEEIQEEMQQELSEEVTEEITRDVVRQETETLTEQLQKTYVPLDIRV